jgi:hypothetical protein
LEAVSISDAVLFWVSFGFGLQFPAYGSIRFCFASGLVRYFYPRISKKRVNIARDKKRSAVGEDTGQFLAVS